MIAQIMRMIKVSQVWCMLLFEKEVEISTYLEL